MNAMVEMRLYTVGGKPHVAMKLCGEQNNMYTVRHIHGVLEVVVRVSLKRNVICMCL